MIVLPHHCYCHRRVCPSESLPGSSRTLPPPVSPVARGEHILPACQPVPVSLPDSLASAPGGPLAGIPRSEPEGLK